MNTPTGSKPTQTSKSTPLISSGGNRPDGPANLARRRVALKLGTAAPVIMTLASRPVLANACLSNMLSGNLSSPGQDDCRLGWSPGAWKNPGGKINGHETLDAWATAGFSYGNFDSRIKKNCKPQNRECYSGGTLLSETPLVGIFTDDDGSSLREILSDKPGTLVSHAITAMLNARLLSADPGGLQYVMTVQQLRDLLTGTLEVPPGYGSVHDFLASTWN